MENIYIIDNHNVDSGINTYLFKYLDGRIIIVDDFGERNYEETEYLFNRYNIILHELYEDHTEDTVNIFTTNEFM